MSGGAGIIRIKDESNPRDAGRNLLEPKIDLGLRLRQTSGPESIHEDALAILLLRFVIGSLDLDLHVRPVFRQPSIRRTILTKHAAGPAREGRRSTVSRSSAIISSAFV